MRHRRIGILAALLLVLPSRGGGGGCPCSEDVIEIVFIIDTTGSMKDILTTAKAQVAKILSVVGLYAGEVRVGAVAFRTREDAEYHTRVIPLTTDHHKFNEEWKAIQYKGGGIENCDEALAVALRDIAWSQGARKIVIMIGDEGPDPDREKDLVESARLARTRGIVVHAITPSASAWRFYGSYLATVDPAAWKKLTAEKSEEELKRVFTLPIFDRMAEAGGGFSVSMSGARDVVRSVLSFALGERVGQGIDADALMASSDLALPTPSAGRGKALLGRIRFEGRWNRPVPADALRAYLSRIAHLDYALGARNVDAATDELSDFPLLYLSGDGPIAGLGERARRAIRSHLDAGGVLLADPYCDSKPFDQSFRAWVAELYPEDPLKVLPPDHALFNTAYEIRTLRYRLKPGIHEFEPRPPTVWAVENRGRLRVVYLPHALGLTWLTRPFEPPCAIHDEDGRRLTANVFFYALQ